ncbi:MAG: hypothetical protein JW724_05905 [Candidatus Altiarchaeota archaeon]|nr:hypothetical protein [Candidatus Altiarchaeota archaeon]
MKTGKKYLLAGLAALALAFLIAGNAHAGVDWCCYTDSRNNQMCVAVGHSICYSTYKLQCQADGSFKKICIQSCLHKGNNNCYDLGVHTFKTSTGGTSKWICRADGEWKKVQAQSYNCYKNGRYYNPGQRLYFDGAMQLCLANGQWSTIQTHTGKCYYGGIFYNPGETFISASTKYLCKTDGTVVIYSYGCYNGFTCKYEQGVLTATKNGVTFYKTASGWTTTI